MQTLYVKRVNRGKWLIIVEDCVRIELGNLVICLDQSKETLLETDSNEDVLRAEKKVENKGRNAKMI